MPPTRTIWTILLYTICIGCGTVVGLVASGMIIRAIAGPKCCATGDGIGMILLAVALVSLGAVVGIVLAATVLRVGRRAQIDS